MLRSNATWPDSWRIHMNVATHQVLTALAAAALLSGCGSPGGAGGPEGVVTGRVLAAPSCPVQRVDETCPPRPVPGALVIAFIGSHPRRSTISDQSGTFRLTLSVGRYLIRATSPGGYASTAAEDVNVSTVPVDITLTVDSGIR
jgi:hypothetical protein